MGTRQTYPAPQGLVLLGSVKILNKLLCREDMNCLKPGGVRGKIRHLQTDSQSNCFALHLTYTDLNSGYIKKYKVKLAFPFEGEKYFSVIKNKF